MDATTDQLRGTRKAHAESAVPLANRPTHELHTARSARAQSAELHAAVDGGEPEVPIQALTKGAIDSGQARESAAQGFAGTSTALPHVDRIQESFGRHEVGGVKAFVGGSAADATAKMGAQAYASGERVAFKSTPDLRTSAHEAAHVVQQRKGVQLDDGVGRAGDAYEQHADAVAEAVTSGRSAETLLDSSEGGAHSVQRAVQFKNDDVIEAKFQKIAKAGKQKEAIAYLLKAYGFSNDYFEITIVAPYKSWASVGGKIAPNETQTMTVGSDLFAKPFGFIVRIIGHEFQHIDQRNRSKPVKDQNEREFLAYCWEVLDTNTPKNPLKKEIKQGVKMALKYYALLPKIKQVLYGQKWFALLQKEKELKAG